MQRKESRILGDILMEFLHKEGIDQGLIYSKICQTYDEVVGPLFASATIGKTFQNGVLKCKINSSVKRTQLALNADIIKSQINEKLGKQSISKIYFS